MCKLAWRHQFPAIFPWSLFSKPGKKNTEHSKNSIQEVYGFGDHFTWYYQYSLHLQITLVKQKKVTLIFSELVKWKIIRKKNLQLKDKPWHASKRFPWKIHVGFFIQAYYILKESDQSVLDLDLAPQVTHLSGLQLNFAIVYFLENSYVVGYTILLMGANFGFQIWML